MKLYDYIYTLQILLTIIRIFITYTIYKRTRISITVPSFPISGRSYSHILLCVLYRMLLTIFNYKHYNIKHPKKKGKIVKRRLSNLLLPKEQIYIYIYIYMKNI